MDEKREKFEPGQVYTVRSGEIVLRDVSLLRDIGDGVADFGGGLVCRLRSGDSFTVVSKTVVGEEREMGPRSNVLVRALVHRDQSVWAEWETVIDRPGRLRAETGETE